MKVKIVLAFVILLLASAFCYADPIMTVIAEPETSGIFPVGYTSYQNYEYLSAPPWFIGSGTIYTTQTNDILGPFSNQPVHFMGSGEAGSSGVLYNPETAALYPSTLAYRYKLSFDQVVKISSIKVQGAAFLNGAGFGNPEEPSLLRLMDASHNVLYQMNTYNGNPADGSFPLVTQILGTPGATGQVFYLDEFNINTVWSYRSSIAVNATAIHTPEPTSLLLLGSGLGMIGLAAWRRRK